MRAFSLIELSIVLVILGLLTGGILAGQSLIRAAELRSVSTEATRYTTSIHTFRDKYMALPGDMTNATAFWGIAAGTTGNDATCKVATSTDTKTCNGDGNGMIQFSAVSSNETYGAWKHLANAGLIEGSYVGGNGVSSSSATPGYDIPRSRASSNSGWYLSNSGTTVSGSANAFDGSYGTTMNLFNRPTVSGVLAAEEAWNIDTKMDDGKPGQGKVYSNWSDTYSTAATPCTTATSGADKDASYNLTAKSKDCGLFFINL